MKRFSLYALLLTISTQLHALTGNDLWSGAEPENRVFLGYVRGVVDASYATIDAYRFEGTKLVPVQPFCMPEGATMPQAVDIVREHLRLNPSTRHHPAVLLVHQALGAAWPCKPAKR